MTQDERAQAILITTVAAIVAPVLIWLTWDAQPVSMLRRIAALERRCADLEARQPQGAARR